MTLFSRIPQVEPSLSQDEIERSRKNFAAILKGFSSVGQVHVAKAIGKHESTISKMISDGDLERFAQILAKIGLKVVGTEYRCVDPKTMETILHGHRMWVASIESHEQLLWD